MSRCPEEDDFSDMNNENASDAKSNAGKVSSRGSLKRRLIGNSGNQYNTGQQRI
jgi:hypothetical protein